MNACPRAVLIMSQDFVNFTEKNWTSLITENLISKGSVSSRAELLLWTRIYMVTEVSKAGGNGHHLLLKQSYLPTSED